jgi:hypothetical protein
VTPTTWTAHQMCQSRSHCPTTVVTTATTTVATNRRVVARAAIATPIAKAGHE